MDHTYYIENDRFRCLNERWPHQSAALYLLMCGIEQCAPDKGREGRLREGYHLHVILSGEGVVETPAAAKRLGPGQMFLIRPGEHIAYWPIVDNPWSYCWISFNGDRAAAYMREAGFGEDGCIREDPVETAQFYVLCDRILNAPLLDDASGLKRLGLLMEFIGLSIETFRQAGWHARCDRQPMYHKGDYARLAVEYIHTNYANTTVADVAKYLGIDRSYFSSIFKQEKGVSPNEFLLRTRMSESSQMLQSLSLSIQDIARYVGYEDSLTFSKAFKRFFGVSPKYYREMPADERPGWDDAVSERDDAARQR